VPVGPAPPVTANGAAPTVEAAGNGLADVTLTRSPDGHFYADAIINGATIHVLVDTGATTVALSRADAQSAGVQFSEGDFTGTAQTAGGDVRLKPVTLDRVGIGPVEARNVDAVVVDSKMNVSLLGQSWLRRVGTVQIIRDRMILR
jgi:aspartyl protease family protein